MPSRMASATSKPVLLWIATILVGCGLLYLVAGPPRGTPVDELHSERSPGRTDPEAVVADEAPGTSTASFEASDSTDPYDDELTGGDLSGGGTGNVLEEYLEILPRAEAGDSAAQYRLAKLLQSCRFKPRSQLDIENVIRGGENLGQELLDRMAREIDRCGRLAQKVDDLVSAADGWLNQAAVGEDPLALAELAIWDLVGAPPVMTASERMTPSERARRVQEALRARPSEALEIANSYVANTSSPFNVQAGWANDAWWLSTCTHLKQCDRAKVLNHLRQKYSSYEVDEILLLESTIDQSVRTGIWSDESFARLWIVETGAVGP